MAENLVVAQTEKPNCWADFATAQGIAWRAVKRSPVLVALIVLCTIGEQLLPNAARLLYVVDNIANLGLCVRVVFEALPMVTGGERTDPKQDLVSISNAWANGILYGLAGLFGLICVLLPGIYFLLAGSLGIVFVCAQKLSAGPAFEASRKMLKGKWWRAFSYLAPTFFVFGLGSLLVAFIMSFSIEMCIAMVHPETANNAEPSIFSDIVFIFSGLWITWFFICQTTLQVRLYARLKAEE